MKLQLTRMVAAAVAAASLLAVASAQAQAVTGTPYLSNVDPSTLNNSPNATYAGWNGGGATITSLPTGLEVASGGYGSMYYVIPSGEVQTLNANDTMATLTFTVNSPAAANMVWVEAGFYLNDNSGSQAFQPYSGYGNGGNPAGVTWNGNVVTETESLTPAEITAIQAGNDAIYSFNLEFNPAVIANGPPVYDLTFNSLVLSAPSVPEPATFALAGLGGAAMLLFRRRK
jgi:hypothetical protein